MAQYIDKDALVAEIKKRRDAALTRQKNLEAIGQVTVLDEMIAFELNRINSFVDTLEVKEIGVDLGDPKGDKSAKYIINTKSLEVKEVRGEPVSHEQVKESLEIRHNDKMCKENDNSLTQEPLSEGLEEAADEALNNVLNTHEIVNVISCLEMFKFGSKWQKSNLWKPADGDDLPEIDREVIALLDNGKVVFAHRPPEYWDGKDIVTGKVTRNYPKTYDKGGWNIPNIKYWLDIELPKEIEL